MNILHIITHYYPVIYGAENFAKHLAETQAKKNNVYIATGHWNSKWRKEEVINKVKIYRVPVCKVRFIQTILSIFPFYFKSVQIIKDQKIDTIHTHIFPAMIVGSMLKKRFNIKFIATIQGGDIGDYTEVFGPFKNIAKLIISYSLKIADKIQCVSNFLKVELIKMGISPSKISVIPNGVDTNKFKPSNMSFRVKSRNPSNNFINLISTSRLEPKNNLIQLIKSLDKIKKEINFILDIYGQGSQKQKIQNLISSLNLYKQIKLKGYIKNDKLNKILPNYNYFIRLSKQEGFGISFIEAMSCGVIPIATKVGGISDFIIDKKNGYYVKLNQNISKQLLSIFNNNQNYSNTSKQARITIQENYDWKNVLSQTRKLYD